MIQSPSIDPPLIAIEADPLKKSPWRYRSIIKKVRQLEAALTALDDIRLKRYIDRIRRDLREVEGGGPLDAALPKVFAAVCVAARRHIGLRPYDVQIIGGYELHRGRIAEMATGEGKTLVATLPATLNAVTGLGGGGVHIVTVNDYLATRDAQTMSPIYHALGLTVGVIISNMTDDARRDAYRCDIIYATNKELGFDYLRDQIKLHQRSQPARIDTMALLNRKSSDPVMRQLNYAIVDEADSILIDESRTPLIIAGHSGPSPLAWAYEWADGLASRLRPRHDFDLKPEKRQLEWKDQGRSHLVKLLEQTNTPSLTTGESWQNMVLNALRARWVFAKDQHYVISSDNEVIIVDEFTGRRMPGRTWSEGIHQAVQAKEKLPVTAPAETLARTTYQHFFGLYAKLAGMTGTAWTERHEFQRVYHVKTVRIPTHRPVRRTKFPERIFRTAREKYHAVAREIAHLRNASDLGTAPVRKRQASGADAPVGSSSSGHWTLDTGHRPLPSPLSPLPSGGGLARPVLIGTTSIEESESLSAILHAHSIPHQLLNARPENASREADIVAAAGQPGAVTIATNMAGRGTDIKLGPGVPTLGGLHVIGTQRHESRRVDQQLIGRCARQGDPGSCTFFLSLQDPILEHITSRRKLATLRRRLAPSPSSASSGIQNSEFRIQNSSLALRSLRQLFRRAQLKVEHLHYRQRQQLMEYEDWLAKVYHQMGGR